MQKAKSDYLIKLLDLDILDKQTQGFLIAILLLDDNYRDYADVLAAISPPGKTAGEILATGVADVLPFAVFGATVGWINHDSMRAMHGDGLPTYDNRVSYRSGGDMGFGSWNPTTTTTTTTSTAPPFVVPAGP
jgi:hypothetical protein